MTTPLGSEETPNSRMTLFCRTRSVEKMFLNVTLPITGTSPTSMVVVLWMDCTLKFCRSEEHTSELQSLMRISYAVFCLKKKKNTQSYNHSHITYTIQEKNSANQ